MKKTGQDLRNLFSVFSPSVKYLSRRSSIFLMLLFCSIPVFAQPATAQNEPMPDDVAPPPLRIISKDEKDQLAAETGTKDKTSLYLTFLDLRLKKAEDLSSKDSFADSMNQFGVYHGLLEGLMEFLKAENKSSKALGGFRKIEMTLRAHNVRIETVRRVMPYQYAYHVTRLQRYVRRSRAEAAESLFSDSVVPGALDNKDKEENKPD